MTTKSEWWYSSAVLVSTLHRGMCCTFRQGAGWKGRASDGEDVRLRMILTPLQPTTVVRKSPGMQQQGWCRREAWGDGSCFKMRWTVM